MDLKQIVIARTQMREELADMYIDLAKNKALAYTNRKRYIESMDGCVIDLACAMYSREGSLGETSHKEGGISQTWASSTYDDILSVLNNIRLIKAGGVRHEIEVEENDNDH